MSQVTIYVEPDLETKMRAAAKAMNMSQSKWVANIIREKLKDEWPASVTALAGTWTDLPDAEELRADFGADTEREQF